MMTPNIVGTANMKAVMSIKWATINGKIMQMVRLSAQIADIPDIVANMNGATGNLAFMSIGKSAR